jgi:hypothetical protein
LTVEIESILVNEELAVLLEAAETSGQLRQVDLNELLEPLELDPLETDSVYQELDRRGIELVVEEEKEEAPAPPPAAVQPKRASTRSSRRPRRSSSRRRSSAATWTRSSA